jgi:hypothetical protein
VTREPVQQYLRADRVRPSRRYFWEWGSEHERANPHIAEAYYIVGLAKRLGWLKRQPCEVCGDPNSDGHHEDYSKPLAVTWLCRTHHRRRDVAKRKGAA